MLRHCTIAELLDLRDGEGSSAARAHVGECEACRAELDRLHQHVAALKALPSLNPPRDRWPVVRDALAASRRRVRWRRAAWGALAAAASLVMLVGVRAVTGPVTETASAQEIEALVQESQHLEELLHTVGRESRVVNGLTAVTVADLEDRIALIDLGIERARVTQVSYDRVANLWRERVVLMDALVNTHVRQVAYVGY